MSSFRTEITIPSNSNTLKHEKPLLAIGSCFTEHIGQKLKERKFNIQLNPFGITYNPISVAHQLVHLFEGDIYSTDNLFNHNDLWHSFDHHGHFSSPKDTKTLQNINERIELARKQITPDTTLLLTLGTAYVFESVDTQKIVNNCHKLPASKFNRYRLEVNQIVASLSEALQKLQSNVPGLNCLLTVSPVRHLKDGFEENQRSKASLLLAVEKLCQEFEWVNYFPAYEIQLDDLRDYRFYEKDLVHPNEQAVDYIWSKFSTAYFSEETNQLNHRLEKIINASKHRAFHPETSGHQAFLRKQIEIVKSMQAEYPFLDLSKERSIFEKN